MRGRTAGFRDLGHISRSTDSGEVALVDLPGEVALNLAVQLRRERLRNVPSMARLVAWLGSLVRLIVRGDGRVADATGQAG